MTLFEDVKKDPAMSSAMTSGSSLKLKSPQIQAQPTQKPAFQVRSIKFDFPRFGGNNVVGWIFKAEQFFDYYATPDTECITIALVHLDQDIVPWFQMMQKVSAFQSWKEFTTTLETEFGPSQYDYPCSKLFKITQGGIVAEYYVEFTALANRSEGVTSEALLNCFIEGLNDDIRRDVKSLEPQTMVKAVALAKLFEEKYQHSTKQKTIPIHLDKA